MALLQKIFQADRRRRPWCSKGTRKEPNFLSPEKLTSHKWWQPPEFDPSQIRLIVFTDSDSVKKLRFDSKTVKKVDQSPCKAQSTSRSSRNRRWGLLNTSSCSSQDGSSSDGSSNEEYQYIRGRASDIPLLGEMLFGSVAMSYKGSMTKVHTMKSPPQLMLSQVFQSKKPEENDQEEKDSISLFGAEGSIPQTIKNIYQSESESIAHSMPVAIPANSPYHSLEEDNSDFSASGSFIGPIPSPGSTLSSGSTTTPNNSLHRRWLRNQVTSMEYVARKKSADVSSTEAPIARKKKPKIGVSIVISLPEGVGEQFKTFFFSHFSMFEHHFLRLCDDIERILIYHRKSILNSSMEALEKFRHTVASFYSAPRIQRPIWLNMMSYPQQRSHLCQHLIKLLVCELDAHNNKQTNFFMARLLTAVLTHHLAWVPTVMPSGSTPSRAYLDKHSSSMLDLLAQSHPYNPLWAQLGDLYGAIGYPNKIARTVVVGKRADVVCRILYILSYFIRCSEVHEKDLQCNDFTVHFDPEGHVFTWSLSMDETSQDVAEFETSVSVSEQSSTARTDSGFADGQDGLSRDNISLSQGEEFNCFNKPPVCCKTCKACVEGNKDLICKFAKREIPKSEDSCHMEEIKTRDFQKLLECQSLCSSLTVVSDDSTASTVCDEMSKVSGDERGKTPVPGDNPSRETESKHAEEGNKLCQEVVQKENGFNKSNGSDNFERDVTSRTCETQKLNCTWKETPDVSDELIKCAVNDVQYECSIEYEVPVGRSVSLEQEEVNFPKMRPDVHQKNPDLAIQLREQHHNSQKSFPNLECECERVCVETSGVLSPGKEPSGGHTSFVDSLLMLCENCLKQSKNPQVEGTEGFGCVKNIEKEESRSRHGSGQCPGSVRGSLLRGISSVSEGSLTSSTLTYQSEFVVFNQEELPLAVQHFRDGNHTREEEEDLDDSYISNIGRSLLGGYMQQYVPDLALHGTPCIDLPQVGKDLVLAAEHSVLDEPTAEAVCIIANTDKWTVDLVSSERYHSNTDKPLGQEVATSHMVQTLLESVQALAHETGRKMETDFFLMHLEDRLQEIYFSSTVLASYLERNPGATTKELSLNLGFSVSDFQLLLSVTSVHSPHVIMSVLKESYEKQRSSPERAPSPSV
ncbi:Folliculin-interacting protein 1 [Holothuria leucospilota]|uniref:Folliculin-interacting protein 1 n=1 Tax=Holothuria leucospilota TaxID=206669 RepID=A0A9Q0YP14_HOLLE|nr:Folliculin-interacting protein 1 [Holothuria leucospilota]